MYLQSNSAYSNYTINNKPLSKLQISVKNRFLHNISEKVYIQNWVDIESEYYFVLKNIYKIMT